MPQTVFCYVIIYNVVIYNQALMNRSGPYSNLYFIFFYYYNSDILSGCLGLSSHLFNYGRLHTSLLSHNIFYLGAYLFWLFNYRLKLLLAFLSREYTYFAIKHNSHKTDSYTDTLRLNLPVIPRQKMVSCCSSSS